MRPKIVLMVLVLAGLVVAGAFFLRRPAPAPVAEPAPVQKTVEATPPETNTVVQEKPVQVVTNVAPVAVAVDTNTPAAEPVYASEAEHQAAINAEKDRLSTLAMRSDSESLSNILAALNSPDKEVRMAAIDAARQFEDTNAIPALRAAAYSVKDPGEAIAMLDAVQWLSTPTADLTSAGPPTMRT